MRLQEELRSKAISSKTSWNVTKVVPGQAASCHCRFPLARSPSLAFTSIRLVKPRVSLRFPHWPVHKELSWLTNKMLIRAHVCLNQPTFTTSLAPARGERDKKWWAREQCRAKSKQIWVINRPVLLLSSYLGVDKAYFSHYELWLFNIFNV